MRTGCAIEKRREQKHKRGHLVMRKVQMKKSWVRKIAGTDMYILCGAFQ